MHPAHLPQTQPCVLVKQNALGFWSVFHDSLKNTQICAIRDRQSALRLAVSVANARAVTSYVWDEGSWIALGQDAFL